jgi:lysophospholipase
LSAPVKTLAAHFTEAQLAQAQPVLHQFWQQGQHQSFLSFDQRRICYSSFRHPAARAEILVSPGRIEASQKYQEFCYDLFQAGFTVHLIDHRGQGLSDRINADRHLGDVADFQHYVQDFALWLEQHIVPQQQAPLLGLAHSMGCAILCRYLQQHTEHEFRGVIYCSPMFGIQTKPVPKPLATTLVKLLLKLNQLFARQSHYFPGQKPYQDKAFAGNHLTHSSVRYQLFRQLYQDQAQLQLGGVSCRWLQQSLAAIEALQQAPALNLPQLIVQATADPVVDNQMQQRYWQKHVEQAQPCELVKIQGALHEIIFESDPLRNQLFGALDRFVLQLGL